MKFSFQVGMSAASLLFGLLLCVVSGPPALATTEGTIRGTVVDSDQISIPNAVVKVFNESGHAVKQTKTSATGEFTLFPVDFGEYTVEVEAPGYNVFRTAVHVASSSVSDVTAQLTRGGKTQEIVVKVHARRRHKIMDAASTSSTEITKEEVAELPQGEQITLPKLITTTTPGVVSGAFGQMFFRGNHANIQYQIDGVQLPESPSNTFGETFAPRNIDHMEILTGGIPAEYGERLSAVVNIISKTGPEKPGGTVELNYGTFNTFSPTVTYGGSTADGSVHYYLSGNFRRTDRGIDTPNPASATDINQGGSDIVHDQSTSNNEFGKVDWYATNSDKLSFIIYNAVSHFEIPTYPAYLTTDSPLFTQGDSYGNPPWVYFPPGFGDTQNQQDTYIETVWKHTFSDRAFLQVAPYYKYSYINANPDPFSDLFGASNVQVANGQTPPIYSSFFESRTVNNFGLKSDLTLRPNDKNLVKVGFQAQAALARGSFSIQTAQAGKNPPAPFSDATPNDGYFEGVYAQDDLTLVKGDYRFLKSLVMNAGVRFDAIQYNLGPGVSPSYSQFQPRVGFTYAPFNTTKLHIFYGKLFEPAPVENLQAAFNQAAQQAGVYNIKPETADYYEAGIAQEIPSIDQVISVTQYRKNAQNLLDDAQLLNTAMAQPYNYASGFVYGTELSLKGQITDELSDYVNYSYSIAMGQGVSGGIFVFPEGEAPVPGVYQYLDHEQMHTANAGLTYHHKQYWITTQAVFGSGLRTGNNNSLSLPEHFTMDATIGYEFNGKSWWNSGLKTSLDFLNIFNNRYPVTIQNGYNGSHYFPGFQIYGHIVKDI